MNKFEISTLEISVYVGKFLWLMVIVFVGWVGIFVGGLDDKNIKPTTITRYAIISEDMFIESESACTSILIDLQIKYPNEKRRCIWVTDTIK